jgi:hypothetical protein
MLYMKTEHRTQLYLEQDTYARVMRYARQRERSLASVCREALTEYLAAREAEARPAAFGGDPADALVGLCGPRGVRSARTDAATRHDDELVALVGGRRPRRRAR